jgi:hypothetical protein
MRVLFSISRSMPALNHPAINLLPAVRLDAARKAALRPEVTRLADRVRSGRSADSVTRFDVLATPSSEVMSRYLFVDEANQVSVASLEAVSPCAPSVVLLEDRMQLGQPCQGTDPSESSLSVLEYLLQDRPYGTGCLRYFSATERRSTIPGTWLLSV